MDALAKTLLGFLTTAFLAWAAVVWDASKDINNRLQDMQVELAGRVSLVEQRAQLNHRDLVAHAATPAHGDVLRLIDRISVKLDTISERLDRLDAVKPSGSRYP